jgi:hypothetical protein
MKKIINLFVLALLVFNLSNAQKNADSLKITKTSKSSDQENTNLSESGAYKLLYENAKENNDAMITTIQWVIGVSIAFLLAILGSQIFFNWRINKKEIDYIKKDIDEKITELKSDLIKDVTSLNKEQEEKIEKLFEKLEKDILGKINSELDKAKNLLDVKDELINFKISSYKKELTEEVKALQINVEKNEGDIWKIKGVESNALSSYLRTAFLQVELKREVKYILDEIIEILKNRDEVHEFDYEKLDSLIDKLSEKYDDKKAIIVSLYKDKPVYVYQERSSMGFGMASRMGLKKYVKNEPKK